MLMQKHEIDLISSQILIGYGRYPTVLDLVVDVRDKKNMKLRCTFDTEIKLHGEERNEYYLDVADFIDIDNNMYRQQHREFL